MAWFLYRTRFESSTLLRYDVGRVRYDGRKGAIRVSRTRYECDTRIMPWYPIINDQFERLLQSISNEKSECLLAGDYNVDLLKYEFNTGTESFVNDLYCHSCLRLITRPTRFTKVSSPLMDNIITNTFN